MRKERVSREVKMERMEQKWFYCRSGVDERPVQTVRQPTALFDPKTMEANWTHDRFGLDERNL